jgi:hypothetical protein
MRRKMRVKMRVKMRREDADEKIQMKDTDERYR